MSDPFVRWLERRGWIVKRDEPRPEFVELHEAWAGLGRAVRKAALPALERIARFLSRR